MVHVRDAKPADRRGIRDVHVASVRELGTAAYGDEVVQAWVGDEARDPAPFDVTAEDAVFLDAEDDGDVVGLAELRTGPAASEEYEADADAEVRAVYVAPDCAGEGVGTALLKELKHRGSMRGVSAAVLTASLNAVQFYEANGYERVTESTHAFGEDVEGDVIVMRTRL
jgi:GNAT superfamily N-acetyltransferase